MGNSLNAIQEVVLRWLEMGMFDKVGRALENLMRVFGS